TDPDSGIAPIGFSRQKVSFEVVLKPDGSLVGFHDARIDGGRRIVPRLVQVPGQAKPSGSGINPGFLWDNAAYMLGYKPDDPKPDRTLKAFEAFRDRHVALKAEIGDEAFSAVCGFLAGWKAEHAADYPELREIAGSFGVFRMQGAREYVHERPKIKNYWLGQAAGEEAGPSAPSLISGEVQPIARLHEPKIKGVRGGQTSGATLVSFNENAYESYGKAQSFNAPVGVEDAFKYCTALNRLTTARDRQVHLADTTVVFWTEQPTAFEDELYGVFEPQGTEDPATLTRLTGFFNRLRRAAEGAAFEGGHVTFYVLGLSPNAARLSVRFWLVGSVQQFAERLGQHLNDLELGGKPPTMPPITLQRILDQTARERDEIQPLLGGALLQAVLTGGPYPPSLAAAVLRRVRADGQTGGVSGHLRAAIIKAYLARKARLNQKEEVVAMSLDKDCPHVAYHLGRLFAALEKTQEDALGGELNVTIKDRYLSSASANPVTAFPRLLRLHAHHLDKLGTENRGLKVTRERLVQEICDRVNAAEGFPGHLPLDEQGLFFVGYYHQRRDFFTSRKAAGEMTESTMSASGAEEK
ncbi:MAG TPA: type I-C CRISPR-associated protein Cas8c/Csd1, partial [Gammaproteobacteria bacterium]|nr:type I-C CRISPR-associated protein Cas8c/Csd1 [Gammaproteobacteria bacterium]